jgi:hypothetical protein
MSLKRWHERMKELKADGFTHQEAKEWLQDENCEGELAYLLANHDIDDMPGFRE